MVQVFLDGDLVKTHVALEQGKRTDRSDYPPEKIAFLPGATGSSGPYGSPSDPSTT
jgi:hypothetical protein